MVAEKRRYVLAGALCGIGVGAAVLVLAMVNGRVGTDILQIIVNFMVSIPAYLFWVVFQLPQLLQNVLYFVYWAFVGAVFGCLLNREETLFRIAAGVFTVLLFVLHWFAYVKVGGELDAALGAISALFTGGKLS